MGPTRRNLTLGSSVSLRDGGWARLRLGFLAPFERYIPDVAEPEADKGLRQRVTRQGEEAIGKLAQELLENPMVSGAISAAFETRERAMRAQEAAMSALNLPSASDLERLTRRLRSVSQRLEALEDGVDRLEQRVEGLAGGGVEQRLEAMESALKRIEAALGALAEQRS